MCGIAGLLDTRGTFSVPARRAQVDAMTDILAHRGPDGAGFWADSQSGIALGHRRLSIIDLSSGGAQPMTSGRGNVITFNGEIYNHGELRRQLSSDGARLRSASDTEALLALYDRVGDRCLESLVGMFAFAIWDAQEKCLFLARDPIGKKPIYYTQRDGVFAFASEIKALLGLDWVDRALDDRALYDFLSFGFVPGQATPFSRIRKLEPGHKMRVSRDGDIEISRYWTADPATEVAGEETEIVSELRSRLERSVDLRMVADVPLGLFLSGGVDSTAVAELMRRRTDADIHSFSIRFAGRCNDEADVAARTAARLGLRHHERTVSAEDMRVMIDDVAKVFDDPLADSTCVPIYFLSEMAKAEGVRAVLTGDGPDELMLGYSNWARYLRAYPYYRRYQSLPGFLRRGVAGAAHSMSLPVRISEMLARAAGDQEFFWGNAPSFRESEKPGLLSPGLRRRVENQDSHDTIAALRSDYDSVAPRGQSQAALDRNWMAYVGLRFMIPQLYMHRADRLGMRHSIELRAPYLDVNFVQYALSIPAALKVKDGIPKYPLKRLVADLIPDDIIRAPKRGFSVPLRDWSGDAMVERVIDSKPLLCGKFDLFAESGIDDQVRQFRGGNSGTTENIWTLFFLGAWLETWAG